MNYLVSKKLCIAFLLVVFVSGILATKSFSNAAVRILSQRGAYYFNGGAYDLKKAKRYYRWALRLNTAVPLAHYKLADILMIEGRFDEALKEINKEIAEHPDFGKAYYVRGLIHGFSGTLDEGERDFKKIIELGQADSPTAWAVYNDLAWIQFLAGRYEDVAKTAGVGLSRFPDNPWLLNSLGLALINLEKKKEAEVTLKKALALAEKLTVEDVIRAYPGNDPANASEKRFSIITMIKFNLALTQN